MDLRGSEQMKLKRLSAVLLAVLIMTMGYVAAPRDCIAGNDDVQQVKPAGDNGDPDSGGPGRSAPKHGSLFRVSVAYLSSLRDRLPGWFAPRGATNTHLKRPTAGRK